MIAFIRGSLYSVSEGTVVIDTGSLGYEVKVPVSAADRLPPRGEEVTLFTHLSVKEDGVSLYGFLSRDDLCMFRLLITVSGIGPKAALALLSALTTDDIRFAVLSGDSKKLSKAPGIGQKTAQRLCMELKDKVPGGLPDSEEAVGGTAVSPGGGPREEAAAALGALGYSASDAYRAVRGVDCEGKSTEQILREALRLMNR